MFARWWFEHSLRRLAKADAAILRDYASADWPDRDLRVAEAPLLALDFEMDGLKKDAHLLQAGWVPFSTASVPLDSARVSDIRSSAQFDRQAVTIHGISEQRSMAGRTVSEVIQSLIASLSGRILIAHGADIEIGALQGASRKLFGVGVPIRAICTLKLEQHLAPSLVGSGAYRLGAARARYGLPEYGVHDALSDAIASAELLLAQLATMPEDTRLGRLESLSR